MHSEESKALISEAKSGPNNPMFGEKGDKHPFFGTTFSEETRAK